MNAIKLPKNQMQVPWHQYSVSENSVPSKDASLSEKASIIGRAGTIVLNCGASAWRVRTAMNIIAKSLGVTCVAEIGLISINYTCYYEHESCTQAIFLDSIGVNIDKLHKIQYYIDHFDEEYSGKGVDENHSVLDEIDKTPHLYSTGALAFAAAMACAGFTFNLGGGIAQIICVFIAAGCGNLVRVLSNKSKLSMMIGVTLAALTSCIVYALTTIAAKTIFPGAVSFGTGYIGSVLFLVPGFPFITSILDFGKLDMRSGIERLTYSLIIMAFATIFCWVAALVFGLDPAVGEGIAMAPAARIIFRLIASFAGVIGFSMIFNSPMRIAAWAGIIGAFANTLRLELVDNTNISAIVCSFIGAFIVGLLAGFVVRKIGSPRVGITIPAVVVSVPGLFMYRAIYYFGAGDNSQGITFFVKAAAIVFAIGLGILFSRYICDSQFRHKD